MVITENNACFKNIKGKIKFLLKVLFHNAKGCVVFFFASSGFKTLLALGTTCCKDGLYCAITVWYTCFSYISKNPIPCATKLLWLPETFVHYYIEELQTFDWAM